MRDIKYKHKRLSTFILEILSLRIITIQLYYYFKSVSYINIIYLSI